MLPEQSPHSTSTSTPQSDFDLRREIFVTSSVIAEVGFEYPLATSRKHQLDLFANLSFCLSVGLEQDDCANRVVAVTGGVVEGELHMQCIVVSKNGQLWDQPLVSAEPTSIAEGQPQAAMKNKPQTVTNGAPIVVVNQPPVHVFQLPRRRQILHAIAQRSVQRCVISCVHEQR